MLKLARTFMGLSINDITNIEGMRGQYYRKCLMLQRCKASDDIKMWVGEERG